MSKSTVPADGATLTIRPEERGAIGHLVAAEVITLNARRYEVRGEIARGGGGKISRGWDVVFDREVALKEPLDAAGIARLRTEARVLAQLQHPNIVPVYDAGTRADGLPFFAMKLVEGRSLRAAIREAGTLEARLALLPAVIAVADAIAFAHERGVVHRDLKPANVLVGDLGETVVIDWGLAKQADDPAPSSAASVETDASDRSRTATGAVIGTLAYMPPEQARGEPVDARADIYGVGAILYEVLAGTPPYAEQHELTPAWIAAHAPAPLAGLQPHAPTDLVAIASQAMARARAERYATARQMADDLVRFQTGRLVAARRYSVIARTRRLLRRHRAVVAAGLATASVAAAIALVLVPSASHPGDECPAAGAAVVQAWTPARRAQISAAFAATGASYAPGAMRAIFARIDHHAAELSAGRVDACRATRQRGEQSEAMLDVRMRCYDAAIGGLSAVLDHLQLVDQRSLERGAAVVDSLPDTAACARVAELSLLPARPVDPAQLARLAGVERDLARFEVAVRANPAEQAKAGDALRQAAAATGYGPVVAKASRLAAEAGIAVARDNAELAEVAERLRAAARIADRCSDDRERAAALLVRYRVLARLDAPPAVMDDAMADAEGVAARLADPRHGLDLADMRASRAEARGDYAAAVAIREAAALRARSVGASAAPEIEANLAHAYVSHGELAKAREAATRALDLAIAKYGADHPAVLTYDSDLGFIEARLGHTARGIELAQRGYELALRAYGPSHRQVLVARTTVATMMLAAARYAEAQRIVLEVLPLARAAVGPEHELVQLQLANLREIEAGLGHPARAIQVARELLALRTRTRGPKHAATFDAALGLAMLLVESGQAREAVPLARDALVSAREAYAAGSTDLAYAEGTLGAALVRAGAFAEARPLLERSRAAYVPTHDLVSIANVDVFLVDALWQTGDRERAVQLAAAVRETANARPVDRARAVSWLLAHR
jgi:tetratricopeptide (TPR) repeat protein